MPPKKQFLEKDEEAKLEEVKEVVELK